MQTIGEAIEALRAAFEQKHKMVLQATPGLGKTTSVPPALLKESWMNGQKIILLEPRRVAARSAAEYMAGQLGEKVGHTIGYRVRRESRVSSSTRIEVVTEGVFTKMIQDDPSLDGIGLVIFDEFHERSIHSELGLALCLETQSVFRSDLRILLMSATFDGNGLAEWLGDAGLVMAEGRKYPLDIMYLPPDNRGSGTERQEDHTVRAILQALTGETGDVLVFLPGVREIRNVQTVLESRLRLIPDAITVRVFPLHGQLPVEEQAAALAGGSGSTRHVVLSTSVAETSVTVAGVRTVVDSGWSRVSRYSSHTGMNRLETVRVSKASAAQRAGRAGRLGPGTCIRLWTPQEEAAFSDQGIPELLSSDLTTLALELLVWGVKHPSELKWLQLPPENGWQQALEVLRLLGAADKEHRVTPLGIQVAQAGIHPRLAAMLIRSLAVNWTVEAAQLASWIAEGIRTGAERTADAERFWNEEMPQTVRMEKDRLLAWLKTAGDSSGPGHMVSSGQANRKEMMFDRTDRTGIMLAWAYPDRIGQRRQAGALSPEALTVQAGNHSGSGLEFRLSNGRGCFLSEKDRLFSRPWLVVADADDQGSDARVRTAGEMSEAAFRFACAHAIIQSDWIGWEERTDALRAVRQEKYGALILREKPINGLTPDQIIPVWQHVFRKKGLEVLQWDRSSKQLLDRLRLLNRYAPDSGVPLADEEMLIERLGDWLGEALFKCRSIQDVKKLNPGTSLVELLDYPARRVLDEMAPTHWTVPSGSRIPIDYTEPESPVLAVRLQEMFGLKQTPAIAGGRLTLVLHLLSPAQRPVQVTRDLQSFWENTYPEVRKDLRGRYPKHVWPENPMEAAPTARAKPKGT